MKKSIPSNKYLSLVAWLKTSRLKQDLTMRDLGELLNMPHQFIGKVESGERRLDVYEYVQYCKSLNIDPVKGLEFLS